MATQYKDRIRQAISGLRGARLDALLCLVAMLGIGASLLPDFRQVRTLEYVACDFKTLYVSAALYAKGVDPYDQQASDAIYHRDLVAVPQRIFGHMPVYPPPTLLVLWPLVWFPMGTAAVLWFDISLALFGLGLAMMLREARAAHLEWGWRLVILGLSVASPVLAFALDIGNVSVAVAGLCTTAWMLSLRLEKQPAENSRPSTETLLGSLCLAIALCLKPHISLWLAIGIALICGRPGRRTAAYGAAGFSLVAVVSLIILAAHGALISTLQSFAAVLGAEQSSGSMSPASREVLPIGAQITSLQSLLGLWLGEPVRFLLAAAALLLLAWLLLRTVVRSRTLMLARSDAVLFVSAVLSAGMIATYHRAHDGLVLTPIILWICFDLRRALNPRLAVDVRRMAAITSLGALLTLLCTWFATPLVASDALPHEAWLKDLFTLRQAALAWFCLACGMVWIAVRTVQSTSSKKSGTNGHLSVPGGQ